MRVRVYVCVETARFRLKTISDSRAFAIAVPPNAPVQPHNGGERLLGTKS